MPTALIQLVSDESIQNVLPVIALNPEVVQWIVSDSMRDHVAALEKGLSRAGFRGRFDDPVPITDDQAVTLNDTGSRCLRLIDSNAEKGLDSIVNFTGGTKLMSISAFSAAMNRKCPSIYVDTANRRFIPGNTASGPPIPNIDGDSAFSELERSISLEVFAACHGIEYIRSGPSWKKFVDLSETLFADDDLTQACHDTFYGDKGIQPRGKPLRWKDYEALCEKPLHLPAEITGLAAKAGIVEIVSGSCYFPNRSKVLKQLRTPGPARMKFKALRPVQDTITFFTGGWWEIVVADAMKRSERFRHLKWSVELGVRGDVMEEDILALEGVQLAYVSCKIGFGRDRLLPALEEIAARSHKIGGRFTRNYFCIYNDHFNRPEINRRAEQLKIRVLTAKDIRDGSVFRY